MMKPFPCISICFGILCMIYFEIHLYNYNTEDIDKNNVNLNTEDISSNVGLRLLQSKVAIALTNAKTVEKSDSQRLHLHFSTTNIWAIIDSTKIYPKSFQL